jgi:hypothetical protein
MNNRAVLRMQDSEQTRHSFVAIPMQQQVSGPHHLTGVARSDSDDEILNVFGQELVESGLSEGAVLFMFFPLLRSVARWLTAEFCALGFWVSLVVSAQSARLPARVTNDFDKRVFRSSTPAAAVALV